MKRYVWNLDDAYPPTDAYTWFLSRRHSFSVLTFNTVMRNLAFSCWRDMQKEDFLRELAEPNGGNIRHFRGVGTRIMAELQQVLCAHQQDSVCDD